MHDLANKAQMQEMVRAAASWGAPYVFIYADVAGEGLYPSYAESLGKTTLGTELGSANQFGVEMLRIAEHGVKNMLRMYNVLTDQPFSTPAKPSQIVGATERDDYVMAPVSGIYEPFYELGEQVEDGQPIGQIFSTELPFAEPTPVISRTGGLLFSRCGFPLVQQGACVATLVRPYTLT
jgi:N-alpha-acetyl-L-2,4-diaminobutyrate deacetylase